MSAGIYTNDLRFAFVNGWLTGGTDPADGSVECGPGTAFPMEVTLDQVAEIFYRVKDAWFTGGSASWKVTIYDDLRDDHILAFAWPHATYCKKNLF